MLKVFKIRLEEGDTLGTYGGFFLNFWVN